MEDNETLFPHTLARVFGGPPPYEELEGEKDSRLALFDVYLWTAWQVAQEYATGDLLATEPSLIVDNGDGRGTEVQIDFLPEELGGRLRAAQEPPARPEADGLRACEIVLAWPKKTTPVAESPTEETPGEQP